MTEGLNQIFNKANILKKRRDGIILTKPVLNKEDIFEKSISRKSDND